MMNDKTNEYNERWVRTSCACCGGPLELPAPAELCFTCFAAGVPQPISAADVAQTILEANTQQSDAISRMEALGLAGLTVSVCCGPCGDAPFRWSVQMLSRRGESPPFAANDFAHAIDIAEREAKQREWL